MGKVGVICGVVFVCLVGPSAPAFAADTFVDQSSGNDANACTSAGAPCATVQAGIDKAGANDTVRVAPGTYSAPAFGITIGDGKSLLATGSAAATTLETLYVTSAAGTIEGFTFVGDPTIDANGALRFTTGPATVQNNVFAADDALNTVLRIDFGSGSPTVRDNIFTDAGTDRAEAIASSTPGSPEISGNTIDGFSNGINVSLGTATIRGNTLENLQNAPASGVGSAISVSASGGGDTAPVIAANVIRDPVSVGGLNPVPSGITIGSDLTAGAPTTGATLRRNHVTGHNPGVTVGMTDGTVTLDSDLIVGAPDGIQANENAPAPLGSDLGDFTATNITAVGGSRAIVLQEVHATIDSSIVSNSINDSTGAQTSCTITNSRGTNGTSPPTANGCDGTDFVTNADPQFVNAAGGDYRLQASSPMIDAGNAADPGAGVLDLDGDPRAVAGTCGAPVRRDMGADEFVPDCIPAQTSIDSGPAEGSLTTSRSASLGFSSEPGATFQCSLDGAAFGACTSPRELTDLGDGQHTFAVRASDAVGNLDPTPATRSWRVDGTAPETQFDSGPDDGATTESQRATYGFSSEAGTSFECSLDGGPFSACASPHTIDGLADGGHTLAVRATDDAGNTDQTPAQRTLTVVPAQDPDPEPEDLDPPNGEIRKVKVKGDDVKVTFRSDEPGSTFECRLDRRRSKPCTSPKRYRNLDDGKHRVRVIATDSAGNAGSADKARFEVG